MSAKQTVKLNKYKNGKLIQEGKETLLQKDNNLEYQTFTYEELDPGEKIVAVIYIRDIWKSILEKKKKSTI
ncbi:hypothetical protein [Ruminococcus flavefaciens]|uniref:hypothetical protein n=1 Tax=Ruminococcus flavefaciens TaxID=1265 RepID=UPI000465A7CC|nr:hypothetical protein [Ruminococcus flavefaciens]